MKEVKSKHDNFSVIRNAPKNFKTNIEELNLLGENNEGDTETSSLTNIPTSGSKFRIDSLNL